MFSDWIIISYKKNVKQEEDGHCKNDQLTCIEGVIFFVKEKAIRMPAALRMNNSNAKRSYNLFFSLGMVKVKEGSILGVVSL